MSELKVLFTVSDVVRQIDREIKKLSAYTHAIDTEQLKQLIIARTIEDIRLIELVPDRHGPLELLASMIRSNYRRVVGEELLTLDQDVNTHNAFPCIRSNDLSFRSELKLHRHIVTIIPRECVSAF